MKRQWLAYGFAAVFAIAGIAIAVDASAQQRTTSVKKGAKAKKSVKRAPVPKAVPVKVIMRPVIVPVVVPPIEIAPGGNTVGAHAALYVAYANDVDSLAVRSVLSGPALTVSTERIARYLNSERLALGMIAYGASYAATHDQFVAEARKAADYFGRDAFIAKLRRE